MLRFDTPITLQLQDGEIVRCAHRVTLRVLDGHVWVTRAHDLGDHHFGPGESVPLSPASLDVASAEGPARVVLQRPPSAWGRGLTGLVRAARTIAACLLRPRERTPWTCPPTN